MDGKPTQTALSILGRIPGAGQAAKTLQTEPSTYFHDSYINGPRWANSKKLLWQASRYHNLKLSITDHDKGWIRETIYFTVSGVKSDVRAFNNSVNESLKEWNSR